MHLGNSPQQSQDVTQDAPTGLQQTIFPADGQKLSSQTVPVVDVQHWALLEQAPCRPTQAGPGAGGGGGVVGIGSAAGATHAPLWQVPTLQGVPAAFGLILPALQDFLPFLCWHLPRSQRSHSPALRRHLPELAAVASSASANPRTPSAPLNTVARARRREPTAARERERASNRPASIANLLRGERRWRQNARTAQCRQRQLRYCGAAYSEMNQM